MNEEGEGEGRDAISIMSQNKAGKDADKARFASLKMSGERESLSETAAVQCLKPFSKELLP